MAATMAATSTILLDDIVLTPHTYLRAAAAAVEPNESPTEDPDLDIAPWLAPEPEPLTPHSGSGSIQSVKKSAFKASVGSLHSQLAKKRSSANLLVQREHHQHQHSQHQPHHHHPYNNQQHPARHLHDDQLNLEFALMHERSYSSPSPVPSTSTNATATAPPVQKKSFLGFMPFKKSTPTVRSADSFGSPPSPSTSYISGISTVREASPKRHHRKRQKIAKYGKSVPPPVPPKEPEFKLDTNLDQMEGIVNLGNRYSSADSVVPDTAQPRSSISIDSPRGSLLSGPPPNGHGQSESQPYAYHSPRPGTGHSESWRNAGGGGGGPPPYHHPSRPGSSGTSSYIHGVPGPGAQTMFVNPFSDSRSTLPFGGSPVSAHGSGGRTKPRKTSPSSVSPVSHISPGHYLTQPRPSIGSTISGFAGMDALVSPSSAPSTASSSQQQQPQQHSQQEGSSPTWMPPESWGVKLAGAAQASEQLDDSSGSEHENDISNVPYTPRSPTSGRNGSISTTGHGLLIKSDSFSTSANSTPPRSRAPRDSLPMLYGSTPNGVNRQSFSNRSVVSVPPPPAMYRIRVYRPDSSFVSFEVSTNTTVSDFQPLIARKGLVERALTRLYIRELGRERVLANVERPAAILKRRLEQIGYDASDNIEKFGSEEISFFLKFVVKSTVPTSADEEIDFFFDQYEYIDLSGKGISVIPIALHKHAERIVRIDLSRNPMLDIPKDFIDSCTTLRELILAGSALKRIPINVRYGVGLRWLDLSSNRIHKVDDASLDMLQNLSTLRLQNNRIETLPQYFGKLRQLKYLNISNNKFDRLPEVISEMTSIVDLDISFNTISHFPHSILALTMLETLVLVGNQMTVFPQDCSRLSRLRILDCRRNMFTDLTPVCRLPQLDSLLAEGNQVPALDLTLGPNLRTLEVGKNDITRLVLMEQVTPTAYSLMSLDVSNAKLSALDDQVLGQLTSLTHLKLDNNQFRSVPSTLGKLTQLVFLSFSDNQVDVLPDSIAELQRLETLNVRNNNLSEVPSAIWKCASLRSLNATSNVIHLFADPTPGKRMLTVPEELPPLAFSLKSLYLGDNHLTDDVYFALMLFQQLRILNLSLNEITSLQEWNQGFGTVEELYLSGNQITALPDDLHHRFHKLSVLYLNGNKLQSIPADFNKLKNLTVLDVGSNALKYNINNWQFEWNWNFNHELRYLNLSGNRRLEIKQDQTNAAKQLAYLPAGMQNLAEFSALKQLRVLGLMDVSTAFMPPVPDENEDFRVRTSFSEINGMAYGIADALGKGEHVSMFDLVVPNFRSREGECLLGMFGRAHSARTSSRLTKYLQENFTSTFIQTLKDLKADKNERTPDALRRAFLTLNRNLYDFISPVGAPGVGPSGRKPSKVSGNLQHDEKNASGEFRSGACAIVVYLVDRTLYVANVGDALAVVSRHGVAALLSTKHDPLDRNEISRIRQAEAWVSPKGTVNDESDVSRSFGLFHLLPAVNSRPTVRTWDLQDFDDLLIIANRGLWDYMSYQSAVDLARTMDDPMLAAQKLRDLAISYGADGSTMVMVLKVGDLVGNKGQRRQPLLDIKRPGRNVTPAGANQLLKHLVPEVEPPTGSVALVFTDIQNSTRLWDLNAGMPTAMRLHNNLLRRLLRTNGGYEVKTEGDAFVVSFQDVLSAINYCLEVQLGLLQVKWPREILESDDGKEVRDAEGNLIYAGVRVRMGIHRGNPVCEPDPVTKRMDYFGGVMNRAARIGAFAQGGQISLSAEVAGEIKRTILDEGAEVDPEVAATVDSIRRMGVFIKEVGEKKLKGLEVPEVLSVMYPRDMKARLELHEQGAEHAPKHAPASDSRAQFSILQVRQLAKLCARLETLSSNRVLRSIDELPPDGQADEDSRILYTDPDLFQPSLKDDSSDADMMAVLDNLSTRVQNAMMALDSRPAAVVEETRPLFDDLLALLRQCSQDEQMAIAAALGLNPAGPVA